jgi:hypothetical protein
MYDIPPECVNVSLKSTGERWLLSYFVEGSEKFQSLWNDEMPCRLLSLNQWNNAAFVITYLPYKRFTFPFGKHKGKTVEEVPEKYVQWWWDNVIEEVEEPKNRRNYG